jgi:hypothetical protein
VATRMKEREVLQDLCVEILLLTLFKKVTDFSSKRLKQTQTVSTRIGIEISKTLRGHIIQDKYAQIKNLVVGN